MNAIPGGKALYVPDPSPQAHYAIETNPRYSTMQGLYGSNYLLDKLSNNREDYQFLGDNGFDERYVQQQKITMIDYLTSYKALRHTREKFDNNTYSHLIHKVLLPYCGNERAGLCV
ncbi:hypothetical protein PT277_05100 [Acetobacteraceae bacterium ESL0709]|nr:hypothetical protein [Acetobacteraceae bacterium ESL0697]MDF7678072.1 hypothetical protein [Acetobacteraceae bacterium ESL0709]